MPTIHCISKKQLTFGDLPVLEICFEKPENLRWKPGQFFAFSFPQKASVRRFYSIASLDTEPEITLLIKITPNGYAAGMFSTMKPGDAVEISGPIGKLTIPENQDPLIMVATGTGIAPFIPILEQLATTNPNRAITVLWGLRNETNLFYENELKEIAKQFNHCTIRYCFSKPTAGISEYVTDALKQILPNNPLAHVLIAGIPKMVHDTVALARENGIPESHILVEHFTPGMVVA